MFDKGRTNARLSIIAEQCASAALEVARQDYREYMAALTPGQTVEPMGKLKGRAGQERLYASCEEFREKAAAVLAQAEREASDEMAEAPSAAALAYVQALGARSRVTKTELEAAFRNYGDNWSIYRTLRDIEARQAREGHPAFVTGISSTLDGAMEYVEDAKKAIDRFINGVRFQEYKDENDLKSRLSFLQMALNGIADGNAFAGIVGGITGGHEGGEPSGDGASQGE